MRVRARVIFEGLVQGVFFRANTKKCADDMKLTGWVRNTHDGNVEAIFEGEEEKVEEAIVWCATKQRRARVDKKTVAYSDPTNEFPDFQIRY